MFFCEKEMEKIFIIDSKTYIPKDKPKQKKKKVKALYNKILYSPKEG